MPVSLTKRLFRFRNGGKVRNKLTAMAKPPCQQNLLQYLIWELCFLALAIAVKKSKNCQWNLCKVVANWHLLWISGFTKTNTYLKGSLLSSTKNLHFKGTEPKIIFKSSFPDKQSMVEPGITLSFPLPEPVSSTCWSTEPVSCCSTSISGFVRTNFPSSHSKRVKPKYHFRISISGQTG